MKHTCELETECNNCIYKKACGNLNWVTCELPKYFSEADIEDIRKAFKKRKKRFKLLN